MYHTAKGFAQIFPYMKPNTIAKYLIELENDGYILSMKNPDKSKNRNNQTKFYTITQKYFEILNSKNQNEFAKNQNEFAKNQNEFAKNQNLYNDFSELENNIFSSFKLEKNLEKELEKNPSCAQADARTLFAQDLRDVANLPQDKPSEQDFEALWRYYPRKVGKKKARETFKRVIKSQEILNKLRTSLKDHKLNVWRDTIAKGKLEYIPHLSTFLHQERWEDEITPSDSSTSASSTKEIFAKALECQEPTLRVNSPLAQDTRISGESAQIQDSEFAREIQSLHTIEPESGEVSLMRNCGFARGGAGRILRRM